MGIKGNVPLYRNCHTFDICRNKLLIKQCFIRYALTPLKCPDIAVFGA